ncbi:MAG: DUF4876 domain-containing protein [Prevotella sp.]
MKRERISKIYRFLPVIISLLVMVWHVQSCTYDEEILTYEVEVHLSLKEEGISVKMTNQTFTSFTSVTDNQGRAVFVLPSGIYSVNVSEVSDDDYFRNVYNASLADIVVGTGHTIVELPVVHTLIQKNNPILIKEVYCGGCQKDDGSGQFYFDKCIILYNNSSQRVSLDNVSIGIVEPYNAEASAHNFMSNGVLSYAEEDWVPAINGIWTFGDGQSIEAYSELVINVHGAIDNTQTYSQSVNYANSDYYCMYDVESASSDGGKYNNTKYYPSPSEVIPTSHYLKAIKYGQSNAWPMSNVSPAVIVFRTEGVTPQQYATQDNIVYPVGKQGNIVYSCLKVPRSWILDAVEIYNAEALAQSKKRLTPDLDNGYVSFTHGYGHSVARRVERTSEGHNIYMDTNNSSNDFYETESCSLR